MNGLPTHVISDTHYHHKRIVEYEPMRAAWGANAEVMTEYMLRAWEATVPRDAIVLHLGDVALGSREQLAAARARMGNVVLVRGNHDRGPLAMSLAGFASQCDVLEFTLPDGRLAICRHDPAKFSADEVRRADVLLHGHLHSGTYRHDASDELRRKAICCSVEALNSPAPVEIAHVIALHPRAARE